MLMTRVEDYFRDNYQIGTTLFRLNFQAKSM